MKPLTFLLLHIVGYILVDSCLLEDKMDSCHKMEDTQIIQTFSINEGDTLLLVKDIDLEKKTFLFPKNVTIKPNGGRFKNGTLIGNHTKIMGMDIMFDMVHVKGTWNVPVVSTELFHNLGYTNSLRDVIALTSPHMNNKVYIGSGIYVLSLTKNQETGLPISSNTDLVIDGTIILKENSFTNYQILEVTGTNVTISGKGTVCGDRTNHLGNSGEWGMGIRIWAAEKVCIKNIDVIDCWGDCIYIGGNTDNVEIDNCNLRNSRRQGISITSAKDVVIKNCEISNIFGTPPQYGIDIEPNKNNIVEGVKIVNNSIYNCFGGIAIYGKAANAKIGTVSIVDNNISKCENKSPLSLIKAKKVLLERNRLSSTTQSFIRVSGIDSIYIKNNQIDFSNKNPIVTEFNKFKVYKDNMIKY